MLKEGFVMWWQYVLLGFLVIFFILGEIIYIAMLKAKTIDMSPGTKQDYSRLVDLIESGKTWAKERGFEEIYLTSFDGLKLYGRYIPCSTSSTKTVIFSHGYKVTGTSMLYVAKDFEKIGFNTLIIDHRGHGKSEGKYIGMGYYERLDIIDWIKYIDNRIGSESKVLLDGVSMGAATVMNASGEELPKSVRLIIADCGYSSVKTLFKYFCHHDYHIPMYPLWWFACLSYYFHAHYWLGKNNPKEAVKKAKVPFVFIHGGADTFVPSFMIDEVYDNCSSEKVKYVVPNANHAFASVVDPKGVDDIVMKAVAKYF